MTITEIIYLCLWRIWKRYIRSVFASFFSHYSGTVSTKRRQRVWYRSWFLCIAQWESGKLLCMQQISKALKKQSCCEGDGFSLWQSECEPDCLQMKWGKEGCDFYRFKGPIASRGMSAAVKYLCSWWVWSHQDQPAHVLLSICGLWRFQLQCWSSFHGILLPNKLTLQTENQIDSSWLEWFVAFIATDIVLGSQTSPCSSHISPVHISFPQGFYTPVEFLTLTTWSIIKVVIKASMMEVPSCVCMSALWPPPTGLVRVLIVLVVHMENAVAMDSDVQGFPSMGWYFTFYKICMIDCKVPIHQFNHDVIVLLKHFADAPVAKMADGMCLINFVSSREVSLHQRICWWWRC